MIATLVAITFIALINHVSSDCVIDESTPNKIYMRDLFELLESTHAPCNNETVVAVNFKIRKFYFDNSETMFNIYSWIKFTWYDTRFKWNPDDYDGLDSFIVPKAFIWSPLPILHHMREYNEWAFLNYEAKYCRIENTGRVFCVSHGIYTTNCHSQLKNWPYDVQNCTLKFHIEEGRKDNVTFTFNSTRGMSALAAEYGTGWTMMDYEAVENTTGDVKISLSFVVEREALGVVTMVVMPSITVAVLTLTALIVDIKDRDRMYLAIFSLVLNVYLMNAIGELIPHKGYDSPSILLYVNFSLYITTSVVCFIWVLTILKNKQDSSRMWISNFNDYVLNNYIVKTIFKWRPMSHTSLEDIDKWFIFTKIANLLFFVVAFILYLVLFLVYMPQPIRHVLT